MFVCHFEFLRESQICIRLSHNCAFIDKKIRHSKVQYVQIYRVLEKNGPMILR